MFRRVTATASRRRSTAVKAASGQEAWSSTVRIPPPQPKSAQREKMLPEAKADSRTASVVILKAGSSSYMGPPGQS